jgi:hypothetical protein
MCFTKKRRTQAALCHWQRPAGGPGPPAGRWAGGGPAPPTNLKWPQLPPRLAASVPACVTWALAGAPTQGRVRLSESVLGRLHAGVTPSLRLPVTVPLALAVAGLLTRRFLLAN